MWLFTNYHEARVDPDYVAMWFGMEITDNPARTAMIERAIEREQEGERLMKELARLEQERERLEKRLKELEEEEKADVELYERLNQEQLYWTRNRIRCPQNRRTPDEHTGSKK